MPPNNHAVLSASSSHRWMQCTPSARLEQEFEGSTSRAAAEGSAAHALAEHKLKRALKMRSQRPTSPYESVKQKVEKLQRERDAKQVQADSISAFMFEFRETDEAVTEFDSKLWLAVIDTVLVRKDGSLAFRFKNGMEIEG